MTAVAATARGHGIECRGCRRRPLQRKGSAGGGHVPQILGEARTCRFTATTTFPSPHVETDQRSRILVRRVCANMAGSRARAVSCFYMFYMFLFHVSASSRFPLTKSMYEEPKPVGLGAI